MRPPRLLLLLLCFILFPIFLTTLSLLSTHPESGESSRPVRSRTTRLKALFSFQTPSSLFPPSAVISLTDDNSTFFLARPAAFGPLLPSNGLSAQLWIGSGFSDDAIPNGGAGTSGEGELGCSDVSGWADADNTREKGYGDRNGDEEPKTSGDRSSDTKDSVGRTKGGIDSVLNRNLNMSKTLHGGDESDGNQSGGTGKNKNNGTGIQSGQESVEIAGKVALLSRGGCGFMEKVEWAQRRGAVALIVGDNTRGGGLVTMYARGDTSSVSIPSVFTSYTTAHLLSSLIPPEQVISGKSPQHALDFDKQGMKNNPASTSSASKSTVTTSPKPGKPGAFSSILSILGLSGDSSDLGHLQEDSRPPNSKSVDWVMVDSFDDDDGDTVTAKPWVDGSSQIELEGLWVTLTPTSMSNSPFFDTLLVLVVSPLVTLTVVYALLLLRSRIRRRRWRAPKAIVDRLPVRTYHTISSDSRTPSARSPDTSSPSSPLLSHSRPTSPHNRPSSQAASSSLHALTVPLSHGAVENPGPKAPEARRKKYTGRQVECVVCLEEYIDGQSRVMSLPCGHEFHADCM